MEVTGTKNINGYTFTTYSDGSVKAEGTLQNEQASRSGMSQITPAGYDSSHSDKGHLVAARENGPADPANVFTQDRHVNRSTFSTIEKQEARLMNEGCTIQTDRTACVDQPGQAPSAFIINDTITTPEGQSHSVHEYVENLSPEEQAEIQTEFDRLDAENAFSYDAFPNPLPEGMTREEYDAILDEVGNDDTFSIQDDFNIDAWSSSSMNSNADNGTGSSAVNSLANTANNSCVSSAVSEASVKSGGSDSGVNM